MNYTTLYQPNEFLPDFNTPSIEEYQAYLSTVNQTNPAFMDLFGDTSMNVVTYPSPIDSPFDTEMAYEYTTYETQPAVGSSSAFAHGFTNQSMIMVPPLEQLKDYSAPEVTEVKPKCYDIEYLDKFIAHHEAILNMPDLEMDVPEENSWSQWCPAQEESKEFVIVQDKKTNRISKTKTAGRRGRTKGARNKVKSDDIPMEDKPKPKRGPLEGVLYVCQQDGCGRTFTRPYNLTSHMRTHTSDRPYACSHCGRKFARQHDRNRHEKLHWGIRPYACHHCHKAFARMDALNRHLRMENGCTSHHE